MLNGRSEHATAAYCNESYGRLQDHDKQMSEMQAEQGLCGHHGYGLTMFDTRIEGKPEMFKGDPNQFLDELINGDQVINGD